MAEIKHFRLIFIVIIPLIFLCTIILNSSVISNKQHHSTIKIDWNRPDIFSNRSGLGEKGQPVILTQQKEIAKAEKTVKEYSYNAFVSDKISLDRSIPDTRPEECLKLKYYEDLPPVTIIVVFHNEYLSILLRTIHSIINRTPAILLKEIILVDDFSDKEFLKSPLEDHLNQNFPGIVNIIRLKSRSGLVKARMAGIRAAKTSIVVVMDAHMEVNTNWLPPLIEPIVDDYKIVTQPVIDYIDWNTLEYSNFVTYGERGGFAWNLQFNEFPRELKVNQTVSDPYENPVILGAATAFSKKWFFEINGYDEKIEIWGGEQYDLSFKVWRCGGKILGIPCSRVGHNYKGSGYHPYMKKEKYLLNNYRRVVETWFDDYKNIYYNETHLDRDPSIDVSDQIKWQKEFGCKSFKWFLDTIIPEMAELYPFNIPPSFAHGIIQSVAYPYLCVDTLSRDNRIGIFSCSEDPVNPQLTQLFIYSFDNEIRLKYENKCWDVWRVEENNYKSIDVVPCHHMGGNQRFIYDRLKQVIYDNRKKLCLDIIPISNGNQILVFTPCKESKISQRWLWGYTNSTALMKELI